MNSRNVATVLEKVPMSPHTVIFWRHVAGIAVVLLAQHPRLYDGGMMFFGLWSGTLAVAFGGAAIAVGLSYLFLTKVVKGKAWGAFVVVAWLIASIQLFGEWALPSIVQQIAAASFKSSMPPGVTRESAIPARGLLQRQEEKRSVLSSPSQSADFDFAGARKAGATDAEIVDYLRTNRSSDWFDFDAAIKDGASPTQIVELLIKHDAKARQSNP